MRGTNLASANLRNADLRGADLTGADLTNTGVAGTNLSYAILSGLNSTPRPFDRFDPKLCPKLVGADARGATGFAGMHFPVQCQWAGVNLAGADLRRTVWYSRPGPGVDLRGADLRNADLRKANLRGADLTGAKLQGTKLEGVLWGGTKCPDGTLSNNDLGTCEDNLG